MLNVLVKAEFDDDDYDENFTAMITRTFAATVTMADILATRTRISGTPQIQLETQHFGLLVFAGQNKQNSVTAFLRITYLSNGTKCTIVQVYQICC